MIVHNLEQLSPEWFDLRRGKVTGTSLKRLVSSKNLELIDELVSDLVCGSQDIPFDNEHTERGRALEPIAKQEYTNHTGVILEDYGFIQSEEFEWFGLSPDGIGTDPVSFGMVGCECKAPIGKNHVRYIRQDKIPAEYNHQVLGYFVACDELERVDFVSYCPDFEPLPIWIKTITREEAQSELDELTAKMKDWEEKYFNALARFGL